MVASTKKTKMTGKNAAKFSGNLWSIEQERFMGMHAIFENGD